MCEVGKTKGKIDLRIIWYSMTWPAVALSAIAPAMMGILLALQKTGRINGWHAVLLILIPAFMNASVNAFNDYFDYLSGNDTGDNVVSESDAPLAFHSVEDARAVLYAGLFMLGLAGVMGIKIIADCGLKPFWIGMAGAVCVLTYSGRSIHTSYLPIGEVLSGFVLGGLVPLGVYTALTGRIDLIVLWQCIPMMLIVGQFMLINNTSDLERDQAVGRKTLPILIGRSRAIQLARGIYILWMIQMACLCLIYFKKGALIMMPVMAGCFYGIARGWHCQRVRETKNIDTWYATIVALCVGIGYPLTVFIHLIRTI